MKRCIAGLVLIAACLFLGMAPVVRAQETVTRPTAEQIPGPSCGGVPEWSDSGPPGTCTASQIEDWLHDVTHWRNERRIRIGFDDSAYRDPALLWTQSSFVQPQMRVF
jgi:gamma-glutamyl hercynylcysteine S-oxide synthase